MPPEAESAFLSCFPHFPSLLEIRQRVADARPLFLHPYINSHPLERDYDHGGTVSETYARDFLLQSPTQSLHTDGKRLVDEFGTSPAHRRRRRRR